MLVLFETPAGYALFQAKDDSKFTEVDDIVEAFKSGDSANKHMKLKAFQKFEDTSEALVGSRPTLTRLQRQPRSKRTRCTRGHAFFAAAEVDCGPGGLFAGLGVR